MPHLQTRALVGPCGNNLQPSSPILAKRKRNPVHKQPKPYRMLRRRLMEDASAKYFVGQLTSAMVNPCQRICASIWLSNTKSSELFARSSFSNRSEEHTSELQSTCNLVCRLL